MAYQSTKNGTADVSSWITLRAVSAPQYGCRIRLK